MDPDPSLHHHLSSYRPLQPNLQHQPQHPQHVPQHHQHSVHHNVHGQPHQHQHSPHGEHRGQHGEHQYASHNGLDLSCLVNDDYHHDLQGLQAVNHASYHQQPFEGHRHMQHESHTPEEAHHVEHHGHHHQEHHVQGNIQHNVQQQQHTHPSLRPYSLMHQGSGHGMPQMGVQQDDVFGNQTAQMAVSHTPKGHPHLAPQPATHPSANLPPAEDEKVDLNGEKKFKIVPNPPDLEAWRQKLFDVNEMITLSEDEYYTYFPHVDNVYSHRSTQKYKRKPFVSHYWDCRLKGRPPGTPKSEDPAKKKRKRTARERDLCDVKIKITEYFEGAMLRPGFVADGADDNDASAQMQQTPDSRQQHQAAQMQDGQHQQNESADPSDANNYYAAHSTPQPQPNLLPQFQTPQPPPQPNLQRQSFNAANSHPGASGAKYFTIQRVNGNGGNGKGDGVAGPHKHLLADSDKIKKNSVIRALAKEQKEIKRATGVSARATSIGGHGGNAVAVRKATGEAATTIRKHIKAVPKDGYGVTLFGNCLDVETQRCWIALEVLKIPYQYIETDSQRIPEKLAEVIHHRPSSFVLPAIRKGNWGVFGAKTTLEYLNEVAEKQTAQSSSTKGTHAAVKPGGASGSRRASSRTASLPNPETAEPSSMPVAPTVADVVKWAGAVTSSYPNSPGSQPMLSTSSTPTFLLPADPQDRAYARQWASFVDSTVLPAYHNYLAHSTLSPLPADKHSSSVPGKVFADLQNAMINLVGAAHPTGPYFSGENISLVDVVFAPVAIRIGMLLVGGEKYGGGQIPRMGRGWFGPKEGTRLGGWSKALEQDARVKATCCEADSYEEEWQKEQALKAGLQIEDDMGRRCSDQTGYSGQMT